MVDFSPKDPNSVSMTLRLLRQSLIWKMFGHSVSVTAATYRRQTKNPILAFKSTSAYVIRTLGKQAKS